MIREFSMAQSKRRRIQFRKAWLARQDLGQAFDTYDEATSTPSIHQTLSIFRPLTILNLLAGSETLSGCISEGHCDCREKNSCQKRIPDFVTSCRNRDLDKSTASPSRVDVGARARY